MKRVISSSSLLINVSGCYWDYDEECYQVVPNRCHNWSTVEDAAEAVVRYLHDLNVEVVIVDGDLEFDSDWIVSTEAVANKIRTYLSKESKA